MLSKAQTTAIEYARHYALERMPAARKSLNHILTMSDIAASDFDQLLQLIRENARVALHFHPDRVGPSSKSVAESLLESGTYKSQFDTLISSGSVSAHAGGARDEWERALFGEAYHKNPGPFSKRPKYGALDLTAAADGPSPRFGSCYFLLKTAVNERCTFTYGDSYRAPVQKGTIDSIEDIFMALFSDAFEDEVVLGLRLRPDQLIEKISDSLSKPIESRFVGSHQRILDHYIEAQVHGDIDLARDVEALVADSSFRGTATEVQMQDLSAKFNVRLLWHAGFRLATGQVPKNFRGAQMPSLAKRVAREGTLTVRHIGEAASIAKLSPELWSDWGAPEAVLQDLKLLWHVLLRYGEPFEIK